MVKSATAIPVYYTQVVYVVCDYSETSLRGYLIIEARSGIVSILPHYPVGISA